MVNVGDDTKITYIVHKKLANILIFGRIGLKLDARKGKRFLRIARKTIVFLLPSELTNHTDQ